MIGWKTGYCFVLVVMVVSGLVSNTAVASIADSIDLRIVDLNGTLTDEDRRTTLAAAREQIRFHSRHFAFNRSLTLRVRYFTQPHRYLNWRDRTSRSRSPAGYYSSRLDEATVNHGKYYRSLVVHEVHHQIFAKLMRRSPRWLDEGLSEFYQRVFWREGRPYVYRSRPAMAALRKWDRYGASPSVREIISMPARQFADLEFNGDSTVRYVSWGIVYLMMTSSAGKELLSKAIGEQLRNPRRRNHLIMDDVYPGGIDNLERRLRRAINRLPRAMWLR